MQYTDGCPKGPLCLFCHGWKELEYHKNNFKVKKCNLINCPRIGFCPFLHEGEAPEEGEKELKKAPQTLSLPNSFGSQSTKNFSFSQERVQVEGSDPYGLLNRQRSGHLFSSKNDEDEIDRFSLKKESFNYNCFSIRHLNSIFE